MLSQKKTIQESNQIEQIEQIKQNNNNEEIIHSNGDFVIIENENKVNKNRFLRCCTSFKKQNEDTDINNNIKQLKIYKNDNNIQVCKKKCNLRNINLNENDNSNINDVKEENDLNKDNQQEAALNNAQDGCNDCGVGCSKVCSCIGFFIESCFIGIKNMFCCCFNETDKKSK